MNRETIIGTIIEKIRLVVPDVAEADIGASDSMAGLGLDSVDRSEVVILTLEALGLDVPLVKLHGPRNIGELADLLHAKLAA